MWVVHPMLSGLHTAEGGFEMPLGWFGVKWRVGDGGKEAVLFETEVEMPLGTKGTVVLLVEGHVTIEGDELTAVDGQRVHLAGGTHLITVQQD